MDTNIQAHPHSQWVQMFSRPPEDLLKMVKQVLKRSSGGPQIFLHPPDCHLELNKGFKSKTGVSDIIVQNEHIFSKFSKLWCAHRFFYIHARSEGCQFLKYYLLP